MNSQTTALIEAIEAQEKLRGQLPNSVIDTAVAILREKLAQQPQRDKQRKQVTVLFADMVGFTAMLENMDAEDASDLINQLWTKLDQLVIAHGGYVDKHLGDGLMGLWGVGQAREDDPIQAIRAALAMQTAVAQLNTQWQTEKGFPQQAIRIGVHTGLVLLGTIGINQEFTAIGDTVNSANRLQHAAPPGGIFISDTTYQQVRGIFDITIHDPIALKGKSEPFAIYAVHQEKPRAFHVRTRGIEGVQAQMVGRQQELARLKNAFETMLDTQHFHRAIIVGDAGVGKTRLIDEFDNWIELHPQTIFFFQARADETMQNSPYGLLRDLFKFRFQILDSDTLETVYAKMEAGFRAVFNDEDEPIMRAHIIGQLLGFDFSQSRYVRGILEDSNQIRQRAITYLTRYFEALCQIQPTLILLDDIHWADESSLATLQMLGEELPDSAWLIVGLTRANLLERHPAWGAENAWQIRIDLLPLSEEESYDLIRNVLPNGREVPIALQKLVAQQAEGNPFYVEELIKMLLDDGIIQQDEESWQIDSEQLQSLRVPSTLTGILQARLDRLPPQRKQTIQQAAVVGRIFWDDTLTYIKEANHSSKENGLPTTLLGLQRRGLIYAHETAVFDQVAEYTFKHALLRDVTYESVLKQNRRQYHSLTADWLIERSQEGAGQITHLIAHHLELAGRNDEAASYWHDAGKQAHSVGDFKQAKVYFKRGLTLVTDRAMQASLLGWMGWIVSRLGDYEVGETYLKECLQVAEAVDEGTTAVTALYRLGDMASNQGRNEEGVTYCLRAVEVAQKLDDKRKLSAAHHRLSVIYIRTGKFEEAQHHLKTSLTLAEKEEYQTQVARVWNALGVVAALTAQNDQAKVYFEQFLTSSRQISNRDWVAVALANLGEVARKTDDYETARIRTEEALSITQEIGAKMNSIIYQNNLGHITAAQKQDALASRYYQAAIRDATQINAIPIALEAIAGFAGVLARQEQLSPALYCLGFVQTHPACMEESKALLESTLEELQDQLSPKAIEEGLSAGKNVEMGDVLALLGLD